MKNRIGVYICQCGSNISDYVDVEKVREAVEQESGVVLAKTTMFACADSAQKEIIEDIQQQELDSMVIASCSPKLHLFTFRNVAIRAGLNPYNYVQVNIREQGSWAHSDNPAKATEKSINLVLAGIARVKHSQALILRDIPSENAIVIVGAGVAGMRAAIELADMGTEVYLLERSHFVGGRTAQWEKLYTTDETGPEIIKTLYDRIKKTGNITLFTGAEIVVNAGSVGDYEVTVKIHPRYVTAVNSIDPSKVDKAVDACPLEVDDDFNFNLTKRKAIYKHHPGQYPEIPAIDPETCDKCGKCLDFLPEIDLEQKPETITLKAGAILLTTGFDPYEPKEGEFGYKELNQVITLQQLKRLISLNGKELMYKKKQIRNMVYIYCVGSCQTDGENKYCSRYCCTAAMHTALEARKKFQEINNYHLTRDLRTYGKQEIIQHQALNQGDMILRFSEDSPPEITQNGETVLVKINDILTGGMELEIEADLVVLVTGMVPRMGDSIAEILKVPRGRDRFFNEVHPKLRPVETVIDGIFIAGTCQGPKNITESMQSALSAASKANSLISKDKIELEPILAIIDVGICKWCDKCETVCPYDAISKSEQKGKAVAAVDEAKCKGCGMCLPVCPVNAIQLTGYTDVEMESMIEAIVE